MRILYLVNALVYGGAELQTVDLACRMRARGHDVFLCCMRPPEALTERLDAAGIPWESFGMPRGIPSPRAFRALVARLCSFRPDAVHTNLTHANVMGRCARAFARIPRLVSTIHSTKDRQRWAAAAYRLTDRWCDLTTGPSRAVAEAYVGRGSVPASKMRVVPNGIDCAALDAAAGDRTASRIAVRAELALEPTDFAWLAAGRLMPAKDYPSLLRAWSAMNAAAPESRSRSILFIAGEGPLREELDSLVLRLGIEDSVRFLGLRRDLPAVMAAADAFVISSAWEGFGLVVAEALYAGLPVAATASGGIPEILAAAGHPGDLGLRLASPGSGAELSGAMAAVMALPADPAAGARRRNAVAAAFGLDAVADTWERIYLHG